MRLTVNRKTLLGAFDLMAKVVPTKRPIPAITCVLISAEETGWISLTGTDLDTVVITTVEADVDETGTTVIPLAPLFGFVKGGLGDTVDVFADHKLAATRCGKARIILPTLSPQDFPSGMADRHGDVRFHYDGALLFGAMKDASYAVCRDGHRHHLQGYSLCLDGREFVISATDGYCATQEKLPTADDLLAMPSIIIPPLPISFAGPVQIEVSQNLIRLESAGATVVCKLFEGTFPDLARIIPTPTYFAQVNRTELLDAIRRCTLNDGTAIALTHMGDGVLGIIAEGRDGTTVSDEIGISGDSFSIGIAPALLADTLASYSCESITFGFAEVGRALVVTDPGRPGRIALAMPIQVPQISWVGKPLAGTVQS